MRIPESRNTGKPTVSPTLLRTYGYNGFSLFGEEAPRGCPRQYQAKYDVAERPDYGESEILLYGRIIHDALELMETQVMGPEEALAKAWNPILGPERYAEALDDLRSYIERESSPLDRYATDQTELNLTGLLYVDEDFGEIWSQARADRIALDFDDPNTIHAVDFKTNRHPPALDDVKTDFQLKNIVWLIYQNRAKYWPDIRRPRVIAHLDAIKWRELQGVYYSDADLEAWHAWTVAAVRQILRDEEAKPILNEGCGYCPVRDTCPVYLSTPDLGLALLQVKPDEGEALVQWRDKANATRLLLEKAVKEVDGRIKTDATRLGEVTIGSSTWRKVLKYSDVQDMRELHRLLKERFYDEVTITKGRLEALARDAGSDGPKILATRRSEPSGTQIKRIEEKQ